MNTTTNPNSTNPTSLILPEQKGNHLDHVIHSKKLESDNLDHMNNFNSCLFGEKVSSKQIHIPVVQEQATKFGQQNQGTIGCSINTQQSSKYEYQPQNTDFPDVNDVAEKIREDVVNPPTVTPGVDKMSQRPSNLEQGISVIALADKSPTLAFTVDQRAKTIVTFNELSNSIDTASIRNRLEEWDPFWWNEKVSEMKSTSPVASTLPPTDLIKTAASLIINTDSYRSHINSWGGKDPKQEKYSVLLRMLPLENENDNLTRSDNHIWPKGTFIQLSSNKPMVIDQRKQINHDRSVWRFMSRELSLAPHITDPKIPTQIHIFCYDDQIYTLCVSLSRYRSVDEVLQSLLDKDNPQKLCEISFSEGFERTISFAASLVSVDIDGDADDETDEVGKFVVSLICPLSRTIMELPVRGKKCLHQQVSWTRQSK